MSYQLCYVNFLLAQDFARAGAQNDPLALPVLRCLRGGGGRDLLPGVLHPHHGGRGARGNGGNCGGDSGPKEETRERRGRSEGFFAQTGKGDRWQAHAGHYLLTMKNM